MQFIHHPIPPRQPSVPPSIQTGPHGIPQVPRQCSRNLIGVRAQSPPNSAAHAVRLTKRLGYSARNSADSLAVFTQEERFFGSFTTQFRLDRHPFHRTSGPVRTEFSRFPDNAQITTQFRCTRRPSPQPSGLFRTEFQRLQNSRCANFNHSPPNSASDHPANQLYFLFSGCFRTEFRRFSPNRTQTLNAFCGHSPPNSARDRPANQFYFPFSGRFRTEFRQFSQNKTHDSNLFCGHSPPNSAVKS